MEQITLTGSFTHHFNQDPQTFFIGQRDGCYGVIAAGSWDTVLPFCFDGILSCPNDILSVAHNGTHTYFSLIRQDDQVWAIPVSSACSEQNAICLPA